MKTIGKKKKRKKAVKSKPTTKAMEGGSDKVWIGEQDARTLAEAETILNDPKRKKGAITQAKKIAHEKVEQAKAMLHVAAKDHVKKPQKGKKSKKKEAAFSG
jgi:hypothetical protein